MHNAFNKLHPWPVIQSFLGDLNSSDELVRLISRAGIEIDIQLAPPADFSHSTRIRAYLPRVQKAIGAFNEDEKLRITAVIARELVKGIRENRLPETFVLRMPWGEIESTKGDACRGLPKIEPSVLNCLERCDLLVLHDGPNVAGTDLPGWPSIRHVIEAARRMLVIRGHDHWANPLAVLANGTQVLNVEGRVVVLQRTGSAARANPF